MDRIRLGRSIRALRVRRRWRQADLSRASGVSSSAIGRLENGKVQRMAWGDLEAVAEALDAQLGFDFRWRGGDLDRLLDAAHAAIVERLVRLYRAAGWEVIVEATFSEFGERGSIDVLAWHAPTAQVAVNEVKATIADAGRTVMGIDRKGRLAPIVARKHGWTCRGVSRFLVIAEGPTARRRIAEHAAIFRTSFPMGGRESRAWIVKPTPLPAAGLIFLSYPRRVGRGVAATPISRVRRRGPRTKATPGGSIRGG